MRVIKKITNVDLHGFYDSEPIITSIDYAIFDVSTQKTIYQASKYCGIKHYLENYVVCNDILDLETPDKITWFLIDKVTLAKKVIKEIISKTDIFYFRYYEDFDSFLIINNIQNKLIFEDTQGKIKWELADSDLIVTHRYKKKLLILPFLKKYMIRCIDLEIGRDEWSVDISEIGRRVLPSGKVELGKVHSPMVKLYENIAVIPILSWGTIGIDISTGSILWQLNHPSTYLNYQYNQYFYSVGDHIIEFDSTTGKILRTKPISEILDMLNEEIRYATLAIQGVSISEKYIIFGNRGYVWVINRLTLELIETVEVDAQGSVYSGSPLYHEGMLYIVDGYGHLHVIQDEYTDVI